jgi:hypothetical protein
MMKNRKIVVHAGLGEKQDTSSPLTAKWAGGMVQAVELLPSRLEAFSSTLVLQKRKKEVSNDWCVTLS